MLIGPKRERIKFTLFPYLCLKLKEQSQINLDLVREVRVGILLISIQICGCVRYANYQPLPPQPLLEICLSIA